MCGIGGILRVHPPGQSAPPPFESIPEAWLDVIDEAVKHRGPDGRGRFRDRAVRADGSVVDVAFVHRRLSIIDHAGGAQPMVSVRASGTNEDAIARTAAMVSREGGAYEPVAGSDSSSDLVAVVFNGCIYNHRELRRELQAAGHEFVTDHSDTEVLLHGWREWAETMSRRLDGMSAFAIWERSTGQLCFARDRAGEKPLYESLHENTLVFASTVPGVINAARAAGHARVGNVTDWLGAEWVRFGYGRRPPTAWVHEVGQREHRHFDPKDGCVRIDGAAVVPDRGPGAALLPDSLDQLLELAVRSRLEADVPLAIFLSGGVDSSLVAHYARKHSASIRSLCVRMPRAGYDESVHAAAVAAHLGIEHTTLDCDPHPAEDLVTLIAQLGLPFGDSSLLPTTWLSRAARPLAAVALGGDGGDEIFGGYERYTANGWLARHRAALSRIPDTLLREHDPKSRSAKAARLARAARYGGYSDLLAVFPEPMLSQLTGHDVIRGGASDDPLRDDFCWYLPQDILRKSDTASMSAALELRAPFLAASVIDAAFSTPLDVLMPRGQRKGLLRAVARRHLPSEIVDRPKMGFAIPIGEWFRIDFGGMKTLLMDSLNSADPFPASVLGLELNRKFIQRMVDEHMSGKRDHSQRLYMLLVLAIWVKTVV